MAIVNRGSGQIEPDVNVGPRQRDRVRPTFVDAARAVEPRRGVSYSRHVIEVVRTDEFDKWIRKLKDKQGKLRILKRIDRLTNGNPGDVAPVGRGVSELRLDVGPGYRVY